MGTAEHTVERIANFGSRLLPIPTNAVLPISQDARDLARQLGISVLNATQDAFKRGTQEIDQKDRTALASKVDDLWRSWWPQGTALLKTTGRR